MRPLVKKWRSQGIKCTKIEKNQRKDEGEYNIAPGYLKDFKSVIYHLKALLFRFLKLYGPKLYSKYY